MSQDNNQGGKKVRKPLTPKMKAAYMLVFVVMFVGCAFAVYSYADYTNNANQVPTIHIPQKLQDQIDSGEFGQGLNNHPIKSQDEGQP